MQADNAQIERLIAQLKEGVAAAGAPPAPPSPPLNYGGGGGRFHSMEERVTRLETHMEYVQRDLSDVKSDLRSVLDIVRGLPTRSDLTSWKWQWTAICVGAIALIVGGIIGGLAWIQPGAPSATQPAPIVITVPAQQPVPPAAPAKR